MSDEIPDDDNTPALRGIAGVLRQVIARSEVATLLDHPPVMERFFDRVALGETRQTHQRQAETWETVASISLVSIASETVGIAWGSPPLTYVCMALMAPTGWGLYAGYGRAASHRQQAGEIGKQLDDVSRCSIAERTARLQGITAPST